MQMQQQPQVGGKQDSPNMLDTRPLLLLSQDDLVALAPSLLELLLRVPPLVLLAAFDGLQLFLLDLGRLLHDLGDMPVALDTPYLGLDHMSV